MIRYVQIFGERCSGTNFVTRLIRKNMKNIQMTKDYGGKHWFIKDHHPRGRSNQSTDLQCVRSLQDCDDTLFVCIFRNPYDWIRSIHNMPHHARNHKNIPFREFIRKPWHSIEHVRRNPFWLPREDQYYFIEEAINILRLRSIKIEHLLNLESQVQHIYFLRYEIIAKDNAHLATIANQFQIDLNSSLEGVIPHIGRSHKTPFSPVVYPDFQPEDLSFINEELDWDLERRVNYQSREAV